MTTKSLEIVNIEEIDYNDDVYLLEVENNHNYFIDDILSKNCQNLSRLEMRTVLSRMGEGVRCFLTGDTHQVDSKHLNASNNGLNWVLRKFKDQPNYAHITLKGPKSRGPIADLVIKTEL